MVLWYSVVFSKHPFAPGLVEYSEQGVVCNVASGTFFGFHLSWKGRGTVERCVKPFDPEAPKK